MPFIDHDKHMTKEEYGKKIATEAKDIIVGQMKRQFEEKQIREMIQDNRTITRERDQLVEKLKSLRITDYLSEQQLQELLNGTSLTKEVLTEEIKNAKSTGLLSKQQKQRPMVAEELFLPTQSKLKQLELGARESRELLCIQMIEARALKNRLGCNTIGKIMTVYRDYRNQNQLGNFETIIRDSL